MRLGALVLAAALALGLASGPARATTMEEKDVVCPVCTKTITVWVIRSTNSFGGQDTDLCTHAAGEQPLSVWVWTCPHCRYSNSLGAFEKGVKPETAAAIRKGFEPGAPIARDASQRRIPAWVKYDLAVRVRVLDGAPPDDVAALQLRGAWATRVEGEDIPWPRAKEEPLAPGWSAAAARFRVLFEDGPEESPDGADQAAADVRAATAMLAECAAAREKGTDTTVAEVFAAWQLRVRGENVPAQAALAAIESRKDAPEAARAIAHDLLDSIARERAFQTGFLATSAEARAKSPKAGEEGATDRFLEAEAQRRLGQVEEARTAYAQALEGELRAWIFVAARSALDRLGGGPPQARLDALWKARLDEAFARLSDPKETDGAARELRHLRDPSIVPRTVAALANEDGDVREAAALVLMSQAGLREEAVDPLSKQMLEDTEEECRWRAALALHAIGSLRTKEAFVEALEYSDQVRRVAIEALGMVGELDVVPELVHKRKDNARDVAHALSCLTNRPEAKADEFDAWWKEHSGEPRAAWVRAGFREAGLTAPDAWREEHVPLLIGWLEDARPHVRANALRILRELTGQSFGWDDLPDAYDSPRRQMERRLAIRDWRRWWAERKGR